VVVAVTPHDAVHGTPSRYEGYELATLLRRIPAYATLEWSTSSVRFHQADGSSTTVDHDQLTDGRGVVAVRDIDAPRGQRWRTYQRGQFTMTPGPFYLVWDGESATESRPWVPQLERITIEELRPTDSPAFPRHAPAARAGFRLFRDLCFACHGVNLAGGRLGPELNVPRNVTEYFEMGDLRTYVRSPRSIRATATMPDFPQLTAFELDAIIDYLVAMRAAKVCSTRDDCARFPRP
jgi:mono/diheme cytochrome c family protein